MRAAKGAEMSELPRRGLAKRLCNLKLAGSVRKKLEITPLEFVGTEKLEQAFKIHVRPSR